jgi:hypothetical protein
VTCSPPSVAACGWLQVGIPTSAYVAETCVVDPVTKEMVIKSRNISGSSMMTVEETCRYTQHKHNADWCVRAPTLLSLLPSTAALRCAALRCAAPC